MLVNANLRFAYDAWKKLTKHILPNGGFMAIYHGRIRKKSPKKQIQGV